MCFRGFFFVVDIFYFILGFWGRILNDIGFLFEGIFVVVGEF